MFIVYLGLVMLLAIVLPFGELLIELTIGDVYRSFFRGFPPIGYRLASLAMAYLPIMLVVGVFMEKTNLRDRLPDPIPGKTWLLFGTLLNLLVIIAAILGTSTIWGSGRSFVVPWLFSYVVQFGPYVMLVVKTLLIVGVVKLLLAAEPGRA